MVKRSLNCVISKAIIASGVVIVGAGKMGKELLEHFQKENDIHVKAFFDNSEKLIGSKICNIQVLKPCKLRDENVLYVIAVFSVEMREELRQQLKSLGIDIGNIIVCHGYRDYEYLSSLDEKYYEEEVKETYFEVFGKEINWQHPHTYNEKINWERLNVKDERRSKLADKLLARDWVKDRIGEEYLPKLYGVWEHAEEIDFQSLPDSFVLKVNNGSGRNIVVKNKEKINRIKICKQLDEWMHTNFAYMFLELHYKDINPKIFCEEYLEGVAEDVYDYNIFCFHGEPSYIWCIRGSHKPDCKASFYTKDWQMMQFSYGYPRDDTVAPRPAQLEKMLEIARVLSKEFEHVRVDLYNLPDGRVLFGEMTFTTWGGMRKWNPEEYDSIFGDMI